LKICWDNLEEFRLTLGGNLTNNEGHSYYIEKESCILCGESYLTNKYKPSFYCSKDCSGKGENNNFYGKEHSKETKNKISKTKKSQDNVGIKSSSWKGGIWKDSLPLYDTYNEQLNFIEETSYKLNKDNIKILEVRCSKCNKWFTPKLSAVKPRIRALNNLGLGESRFYCSLGCKNSCEVYRKRAIDYINIIGEDEIYYLSNELQIWSQETLLRSNYICEICGEPAEHAHHIRPKKLEPFFALDPDNGLALCKKCHYKYGHSDECSPFDIHSRFCK
jgi:hypothetical protein